MSWPQTLSTLITKKKKNIFNLGFQQLFHDDIKYLLSMDKLWTKRRPPVPLVWDNLPQEQGQFYI